jgi:hypothetical protein
MDDVAGRDRFAHNARAYANQAFDIVAIADRFEKILDTATSDRTR